MEDQSQNRKQECVLVMGGLGFIGSHLCKLLLHEGYHVRVFDKLYGSRNLVNDIEESIEVIEGDIEKSEDVLRSLQDVDIVIDLIHSTVPGSSMQNPTYDAQSNILSHISWLSQLNKTKLARIIYISSGGTVYGIPRENPINENHPTDPICSYGITKLAIEKYVAMYSNMFGIDYKICRPANVYGEGQHLQTGQGVISVFLDMCLRKRTIEIWGDGKTCRDYINVKDMVRAILEISLYQGQHKVFNISSAKGYSLNDIITIIHDELKIPVQVNYLKSREFDVPTNILCNKLLTESTGWKPEVDLSNGMTMVYDYLKSTQKY